MKIDPQAKRHATEIINLIQELLNSNNDIYGESFLKPDDYIDIREKLEKKFTRLLNKNKNCVCFPRPGEVDWFNSDSNNCYNNS
jgi:hypothetical protein